MSNALPYRPCVGVMLLNPGGSVFIGKRAEHPDVNHAWQMPQGGIDPGEDPYQAALRELYEETNVRSVEKLGEIEDWLSYDIPNKLLRRAWRGRFRGQSQKWFALRFTGNESEIDLTCPAGHKPEFTAWRWEDMRALPALAIPFKRQIYERVVAEFARFAGA